MVPEVLTGEIPQNTAVDACRYITYKPAPNLTVDTQSAAMQDTAGSGSFHGTMPSVSR